MGQREVLKYLEDQRALGNDRYLTSKHIAKAIGDNGKGIGRDLLKLALHGLIEWKGKGVWNHQKLFRGKKH